MAIATWPPSWATSAATAFVSSCSADSLALRLTASAGAAEDVGVAVGAGVALPFRGDSFHVSADIAVVGRTLRLSPRDSPPEPAQPAQKMANIVNSIVAARVFHPMRTDPRGET